LKLSKHISLDFKLYKDRTTRSITFYKKKLMWASQCCLRQQKALNVKMKC